MTFHARLTELLEKATRGKWRTELHSWHNSIVTDDESACLKNNEVAPEVRCIPDNEIICYLVNHAEAIRDLVVAAELVMSEYPVKWDGIYGPLPVGIKSLREALAKLKEPS